MFSRFASTFTAGVVLAGSFTLLTGMKSCASTDPSGEPQEVTCAVAKDCDGLAHLDCVGEWACDQGQCAWACETVDPGIVLLPYPGACSSSDQCGKGQLCSAAYGCFPSQCTADGSVCTQDCLGLCVDQPGLDTCAQDADCGYGRWCDYTECVGNACEGVCRDKNPPVDPNTGCTSDAECGYGSRCEQICAYPGMADFAADPAQEPSESPKAMPAPACYGQCVPVDPNQGCSSDADCGSGYQCQQLCATGTGMAMDPAEAPSDVPGAMPVAPCYSQCVPVEPPPPTCGGNTVCPAGFECVCQGDPNCPDCDVCMLTCVPVEPPPFNCSDDSQCGMGQMCQTDFCVPCWDGAFCTPCEGHCVDKPVEPSGCDSDSQCAAGEICQMACPAVACTPDWCPPCTGACVAVKPPPPTTCQIGGCSGEICATESMASVCIYSPWYECFQYSNCGNFAADGGCGWEPTPEFQACLDKFGGNTPVPM